MQILAEKRTCCGVYHANAVEETGLFKESDLSNGQRLLSDWISHVALLNYDIRITGLSRP